MFHSNSDPYHRLNRSRNRKWAHLLEKLLCSHQFEFLLLNQTSGEYNFELHHLKEFEPDSPPMRLLLDVHQNQQAVPTNVRSLAMEGG